LSSLGHLGRRRLAATRGGRLITGCRTVELVLRQLAFVFRPKWLLLHLLVIVGAIVMVFLGRWQWNVAKARHGDIQNFAYVLQWFAFAGFVVLMWIRVIGDARDAADENKPEPTPPPEPIPGLRGYVAPQAAQTRSDADDSVRVAYNDYLASFRQREETP
jgi:hypothetical protein